MQVCRGLEFAHSKGIVHRDLKPGNVWLTAEGTARIGDFGLTVAIDRSRLTQEGMMVGTVSTCPPEQAMGGDVTPESDLYALGAMLTRWCSGTSAKTTECPASGSRVTAIYLPRESVRTHRSGRPSDTFYLLGLRTGSTHPRLAFIAGGYLMHRPRHRRGWQRLLRLLLHHDASEGHLLLGLLIREADPNVNRKKRSINLARA